MRLENKVAIITGGASGLGLAAAKRFGEEGAKIVIADFNKKEGQSSILFLKDLGIEALFFEVNVADRESVQSMVDGTLKEFGKIDILVNNAGITGDARLENMSEELFTSVIDVNLKGVFNCTQAVISHMVKEGYGKVINTSSVVGVHGNFGQTSYSASKAGLIGMTKTWAKEFGRKGINVNAVAPGFILTDMVKAMPAKALQMMQDKIPMGRLGDPEEIANAYLYLASDESSYVNGHVLEVDGAIMF